MTCRKSTVVGRSERSSQGRHRRSTDAWQPLPPEVRPGRHRRVGETTVFRSIAALSVVATLTTSTALADVAGQAADAQAPNVVSMALAGIGELVAPDPTPAPLEPATSTSTLVEPTPEDIPRLVAEAAPPHPLQPIVAFSVAGTVPVSAPPETREDCIRQAKTTPIQVDGVYDRNGIARMTHQVFACLASVAGLDERQPTEARRWNGAAIWGFGSLAEQVAAEAVVVAYCESEGFSPRALTRSNGFGYAGLFQMGRTEMARFGEPGSSRYDPVDNAIAAANYFLFQYRNGAGWGGWSPWAVVNTNFDDEVNDQVKVPVLPRFTSTDPDFRGRPGPELPAWAVDPWSWTVPHWSGTGCPYNGARWPVAIPSTDDR